MAATTKSYKNPAAQMISSATRCNNQCKCTTITPNLTYNQAMAKEMSERCLLRLKRVFNMSKCQESQPNADQQLFIDHLEPKESLALHYWKIEGIRPSNGPSDHFPRVRRPALACATCSYHLKLAVGAQWHYARLVRPPRVRGPSDQCLP
jgi:hypothetical protein